MYKIRILRHLNGLERKKHGDRKIHCGSFQGFEDDIVQTAIYFIKILVFP
jgi:hypothetical protein